MRIAAEQCQIWATRSPSSGLLPGGGRHERLPRLLGKGACALQLILTGETIFWAEEGLRIGLVHELCPRCQSHASRPRHPE